MNCNVNKRADPIEMLYFRHTFFAHHFDYLMKVNIISMVFNITFSSIDNNSRCKSKGGEVMINIKQK